MAKKEVRLVKGDFKSLLGAWAFLIGVILALLLGLFGMNYPWVITTLVILGLLVGLFNVGVRDSNKFLFAAVSLVIVSYAGASSLTAAWLNNVLGALLVLFVPATVVVALKTVFSVAKG